MLIKYSECALANMHVVIESHIVNTVPRGHIISVSKVQGLDLREQIIFLLFLLNYDIL